MINKVKKNVGKALIATAITTSIVSLAPAEARNIQTINNFVVPVSSSSTGDARVSSVGVTKVATGRRGVINLSGSGGPTFVATMRNSNRAARGSTTVRKGERVTFATPNAERNYNYWMFMRTASTNTVANRTVNGSWSPDEF